MAPYAMSGLIEGQGANRGTFYGSTSVGGQFGQGLIYGVNAQSGYTPSSTSPTASNFRAERPRTPEAGVWADCPRS